MNIAVTVCYMNIACDMNIGCNKCYFLCYEYCVMNIVCTDKMFARGSPKILALSKATQKKISPKARATTKRGGSPRGNDLLTYVLAYMIVIA